ncbi:hypothetical protein HOH30_01320, partial [Candidatus Woesearchaeota archaeon]|nr:hypothetical protein [Candidatus Woesearchaeota archaeon]
MKKIGVICVMVISFLFIVSCTEKMSDESSDDLSEDMLSSELGNLSESELSYVLSDDQSSLTGQSYKFNSKRVRYLNNLQKRVKPYKITCTDSDKGADYQNVGYVTLKNYPKREIQKSDWCWRDGIKLQEYICEKGEYKGDTTFDCSSLGSDYVCEDGACVTSNVPKADILSIPLPENSHCFWGLNSDKPECLQFYTETCSPYSGCSVSSACPKYYNPVYDTQGTFYPSACWAEQLGIKNYEYGYSYKIQKFFRDIWRMKKVGSRAQYTTIETPNIEFSYSGSGLSGWKSGTFLRSTMWVNNTNYNVIDFNIDTESSGNRKQFEIETSYSKTWSSVYGEELDMLLVFLTFDDAYPTEVLLEWTETYEQLMNDYFASKQNLPNPIHYNIVPVVIEPPEGVHRIVPGNNHFSSAERELIYDTAVENIINPDFDVLVAAPIMINGFGGSYGFWNNLEFIHAPLSPKEPYSESDVDQGIHSLVAFHDLFLTISHEVLHAVGLRGDHVPMGYGTTYLAYVGQNTNSITGKEQHVPSKCDFYGSSSDVFAVELPEQLTIRVG